MKRGVFDGLHSPSLSAITTDTRNPDNKFNTNAPDKRFRHHMTIVRQINNETVVATDTAQSIKTAKLPGQARASAVLQEIYLALSLDGTRAAPVAAEDVAAVCRGFSRCCGCRRCRRVPQCAVQQKMRCLLKPPCRAAPPITGSETSAASDAACQPTCA